MIYQTESKLQGWRALAIFEDGSECLIYLGRSTTQVRAGYAAAYLEVLDDEERAQVQKISLQCWNGAPDEGRWVAKTTLAIPSRGPATVKNDEDPKPRILSFQKSLSAAEKASTAAPREERLKVAVP